MISKNSDKTIWQALRFSKKVVIALLISVFVFTVTMIVTYFITGSVPDTLINEFFGFFKIESGALGIIKFGETILDVFNKTKKNNEKTEKENDGDMPSRGE